MGCHVVLNYKDADFKKKFRQFGLIDVYFDNGGSERHVFDAMLTLG
jgi:NADPH-dependent curcumin reductase CurA